MKKRLLLSMAATVSLIAGDLVVGDLKQQIELGYLGTSGNSSTKTLNARYNADYQYSIATDIHFKTDAYYSSSDHERTDERYRANVIANHHYSDRWYSYVEGGALRNIFEGYNQQYNGGLGMGYVLIDDKTQLLKIRSGYQYRHANFTDGTNDDFHFFKVGLNHQYNLSETNSIVSEFHFLENLEEAEDFETVFRTAMKVKMVDTLSLRVGFEVKYDNTPALNDDGTEKEKTDTTTTVGIVYDF